MKKLLFIIVLFVLSGVFYVFQKHDGNEFDFQSLDSFLEPQGFEGLIPYLTAFNQEEEAMFVLIRSAPSLEYMKLYDFLRTFPSLEESKFEIGLLSQRKAKFFNEIYYKSIYYENIDSEAESQNEDLTKAVDIYYEYCDLFINHIIFHNEAFREKIFSEQLLKLLAFNYEMKRIFEYIDFGLVPEPSSQSMTNYLLLYSDPKQADLELGILIPLLHYYFENDEKEKYDNLSEVFILHVVHFRKAMEKQTLS